ncbi:unnamed protein product [Caenorhabditis auriculariae]|uniref:PIF1/LRR1 pleckstrin homology domain-containing protein n=1 Tax=Caenorhabditis auriculariae TaxID=2777116 RepID=A0A8S1H9S3_9PELO|nr:unnamed protein product [Caenorhabditis auriculariae]
MRVQCEVIVVKEGQTMRPRHVKGFVTIAKKRMKDDVYQIHVVTATDRNGTRFDIDPKNPPIIMKNFIGAKKLTINVSTKPRKTIIMMNNVVKDLPAFVTTLECIIGGETPKVGVHSAVTSTEFRAPVKNLTIDKAENLNQPLPITLEKLIFGPINLQSLDTRIFGCKNLTHLSFSGNPLGTATSINRLPLISRLKELRQFDAANCSLSEISEPILKNFFVALPSSLLKLDISQNGLKTFPEIFHLKNLAHLNVGSNQIEYISSKLSNCTAMMNLNVSNNRLKTFPHVLPKFVNLQTFSVDGNENLITQENAMRPQLVGFMQLQHHDRMSFCHAGRVETLLTCAADAIHRNPKLMAIAEDVLPRCVVAKTMSELTMCTSCFKQRFIRYVAESTVELSSLAQVVDVVNRKIVLRHDRCRSCALKNCRIREVE